MMTRFRCGCIGINLDGVHTLVIKDCRGFEEGREADYLAVYKTSERFPNGSQSVKIEGQECLDLADQFITKVNHALEDEIELADLKRILRHSVRDRNI